MKAERQWWEGRREGRRGDVEIRNTNFVWKNVMMKQFYLYVNEYKCEKRNNNKVYELLDLKQEVRDK